MPSNKTARSDIRLKVSQSDIQQEINKYTALKQTAIRTIFKEVGNLYKKTLASRIPSLGFGELNRVFRFNTRQTKDGILLVAGILNKSEFDANMNFLRFWLYGTKRHWVSLKHKEVLTWGLRNGSIIERGGKYYSAESGKQITAITVQVKPHMHVVERIQQEMLGELIYRLEKIGGS